MARPNPRRNLTRIETATKAGARFSGWEVRILRRGCAVHRFFNDRRFGGKRGALQAAKEFRDQIESASVGYTIAERSKTPSVRNRSGVVGVRRSRQLIHGVNGVTESISWTAQWIDGHGNRKTRSFAIGKHGNRRAFRLAVASRREGVTKAHR